MDHIIDNVLCFMKSAESDFSQEKLKDIMYTFYSVEEIMAAKEKVYGLLSKPFEKRKNPNKKCKELEDLIEAFLVCKDKFNRVKYFADSYKKITTGKLRVYCSYNC